MKVLVTGGAGFMGSWLVNELLEKGYEVVNIDDLSGGYLENVDSRCTFIKADVRDKHVLNDACKGVDVVYHLAAYAAEGQSIYSPIEICDINITPMHNLLVAAVNNNVRKIVFASSIAVYGRGNPPFSEDQPANPEDPYGASKLYCEKLLKMYHEVFGLNYTVLRAHNVYGPRQNIYDPFRNVLTIWMNRLMKGKPPIIYGDGEQTRAFSYVEEVMAAFANAGFLKKADQQIINIGTDKYYTINEACRMVLEAMNSDLEPEYVKERLTDVKHAYCDHSKAKEYLGLKEVVDLKEGLARTVKWAMAMGPKEPTYALPLEITKNAPEIWLKKKM